MIFCIAVDLSVTIDSNNVINPKTVMAISGFDGASSSVASSAAIEPIVIPVT